ncbi:hypothetical protein L598_000400001250 [Mesorhizobium sp. J18]|uniref:putative glycolipid-binding domain-containing protein n=1 Tax=Mesorhizobium sp. J18 TaxID=935263 RepID=UPI00119C14FD|nr:putative glycolipid-binding domain-containing protein [Mesorhizobium sp. J18]TWG93852.1 hypothetical protein L598_000400001250 [Mesorhizobium sp. J18]
MNEIVATAFWNRLDTEGHDACSLIRKAEGWRLAGCAVFDHQGKPCRLAYCVDCDTEWRTLAANVRGSVGFDELAFDVERKTMGDWLLNGVEQSAARGCVDLDLGFTPATNLIAIRRLKPHHDAEIPAPAAYYLEFSLELGLLEQTYRRTGETTLAYASPAFGYAAELTVSPSGFITDYPSLWSGRAEGR